MKTLTLTIPSKTFLGGEYLALKGLGALVFCSKPCFEFTIVESKNSKNPFHADSQAGKFWALHEDFFSHYCIELTAGLKVGGWGLSTAEFIALHTLFQMQDSIWVEQERFIDIHSMLNDYLAVSPLIGYRPSGADLVAQVRGGITYFEKEAGKIETFSWPFHDLVLCLIPTGKKLATYEHLKNLHEFEHVPLKAQLQQMHSALRLLDEEMFLKSFNNYGQELQKLGFVAEHTKVFLQNTGGPHILAAKGCGALGADVVAMIIHRDYLTELRKKHQLVVTSDEIAPGVKIQVFTQNSTEVQLGN